MAPFDASAFLAAHAPVGGCPLVPELRLHLAPALTPLWEALDAAHGPPTPPPPYWAFAWPGSQVLARRVLDAPEAVRGRRVVDFAAGCGLAGIAAARAGAAAVLCLDIDPLAAAAAHANAQLNGVSVEVAAEDRVGAPLPGVDLLLAGDICYEKSASERILRWLRGLVAAGVEVWLADPDRRYRPAGGFTVLWEGAVPTTMDLESTASRWTRVVRLEAA
jgi:predicted nicotinamide N-methyase